MKKNKAPDVPRITIQDRLEHGNLTVDEVCALATRSKTGFYADLKAGLVSIRKIGRKAVIRVRSRDATPSARRARSPDRCTLQKRRRPRNASALATFRNLITLAG
jgi:hypothetical protein